jgi:chromosome segregation protein
LIWTKLKKKINEIHGEEIKFQGQIDVHNGQIHFNQERTQHSQSSAQRLEEQKQQLIARCQQQQVRIEELKTTLKEKENYIEAAREQLSDKRNSLHALELSISEAKNKIKDNEEKILDLSSSQVSLRNEMTDIMKEVQGCLARKRRLELENDKVLSEKQDIDDRIATVELQYRQLNERIDGIKTEHQASQTALNAMVQQVTTVVDALDDLERRKLFLCSQKEFIEKLHTQYQDIPDPVIEGKLITHSAPSEHHTGIIGKVREVRQLNGSELAALHQQWQQSFGEAAYEIICESKFIELDPHQISHQIEQMEHKIQQEKVRKSSLEQALAEKRSIIHELEQQIVEEEKNLSILDAQNNGLLAEMTKLLGELELVDSELSEVRDNLAAIHARETELKYRLETVDKDLSWCENDIRTAREWIANKTQEKEETIISVTQAETEIQAEREKRESQQKNVMVFTETLDNWLEEIKGIDDQLMSEKEKQDEYSQEIQGLMVRIEETRHSIDQARQTMAESETQKTEMLERTDSLRSREVALSQDLEECKKNLHQFQMNGQELAFSERGIKDRLMQTYKINLDELTEPDSASHQNDEGPDALAEPFSVEQMNEEIEKLRKQCDSFGSVNLVAIEEYEELKSRFEFLTQQQADLLEAKSQLMSTIKKINRSTRQMFMDTFTKVSEEFRIYFRMLFGGGEAKLVLLDPENVLESGIDIIARPPGKKLQNISLLSGGEKSLTAIALIFGVFKVNPSPFCILDEIDAALDESNVGRFSYLLRDFAKVAQFIVITHNKKTISAANVMYGITMPETGCSRIVSVKFDEKQNQEEEVAAAV